MLHRVISLMTVAAVLASANAASAQTPETIYFNARVVTVNARSEVAQAVAVAGGTIVAVGSNDRIKAMAGAKTTVVDLDGQLLLPGFYDNHIHLGEPLQPWKYGGMIEAVPEWLQRAGDVESLVAALRAKAAITPKGEWITGEIPREEWPNAALPTRWHLDKATTDHPVALARGPHTLIVNSAALTLAGVTRETRPPGGEIVHDAKGEPTGKILESARRVITRVMPPATAGGGADAQIQSWRVLLTQLASMGVTSVNVAGVRPDGLPHVKRLYERHGSELPRMTVQLRVSPGFDTHDDPEIGAAQAIREIEAIGDPRKYFSSDKLKMGALKMSIDGGLSAPIFWSLKPYENRPGFFGEQRIPDSAFTRVAERAHELGWQLGIHTMGDAAVVMVVNELEKILQARPRADHRHYLHHVAVLPPADTVAKMAKLQIMVASQPGFLLGLGAFADEALEPAREATQQPSRSLMKHGVRVSYGSDAGPYGPLAALYAAVTRRSWNGEVKGKEEAVTVAEAVRMHTFEPAYFTFDERARGSVEVGKVADFVVLDRDLFTIDAERIPEARVLRTIIGGHEVYRRDAQTPPGSAERELRDTMQALAAATKAKDRDALMRLYAPEFTAIDRAGTVRDREAAIEIIMQGGTLAQGPDVEELGDDIAVYAPGLASRTTTSRYWTATKRDIAVRIRTMFAKGADGAWRIVSSQMTQLFDGPIVTSDHEQVVGSYALANGRTFTVARSGRTLVGTLPTETANRVLLFETADGGLVGPGEEFVFKLERSSAGRVTAIMVLRYGRELWRATRKE